jgi:hypothetical protein
MPRNASGTYSLPSGNPVSSGTLIDSNWANNTLNDLANEVTDSLSRSAEGGMLAPLRLTDGVQATPSIAFTNEPSTGLYRAGTNEAWFVTGGNQVAKFTSTGMEGRFAAGAAATPSLAAYNDVNTGLWFPAADTLAASTGGSERLRVDSSGNLGIGTSSPTQRLEVSGDIQQQNANYLRGRLAVGTSTRLFGLNSANSLYVGGIDASQSEILFVRGGTTQMTLDSSGNLGIGTSSPAYRLHVAGTGGFANNGNENLWLIDTSGNRSSLQITGASNFFNANIDSASHGQFIWRSSNAYTERMRLDTSGNLGIGTSSPGEKLDVNGGGKFGSGTGGVSLFTAAGLRHTGTGGLFFDANSGGAEGDITFRNGSGFTTRFQITAAGSVVAGIQTALATTATNGFLYVPTCAGTPTGTPTSITGMAPIVVNTTNNKLYFYSGGAWRDAGP